MKKYFKEESSKKMLLSEYLKKNETYFARSIDSEEARIKRTEYLMDILGDVPFDEDIYKLFIDQFQCFGGRYDVRTSKDTIKGIYEITKMYPCLTKSAVDEIWFRYIKDLFCEFELTTVLDKYIKMFGTSDESFELFIDYVEKKAAIHQQKYIDDASSASELEEEYGKTFTDYVKGLITRKHYTYDEIKKYLPSSALIRKDEQHITEISRKTRIFFGCCLPVSYTMFNILLRDKTLDDYTETPTYYISSGFQEQATFTKQEFLESITKQKALKK